MKRLTYVITIIISVFLIISTVLNYILTYENKRIINLLEDCRNKASNEIEINEHNNTNTTQYTAIIGDWKFTNDSIKYIGNKDTVFVVNLDSLQYLYKYYRLVIEPQTSDKIELMTVCYGDYGNWKKREVNGITQYSLDGINWFGL